MSEKILDSKIQIPIRFKNFIERDELLNNLKHSSEKVIVLNAGAGFGKTMLLANYAVESDHKCAWYHLSSLDSDIMIFIKYLSYSLNKVINDFSFVYDNHENKSRNEFIESIAYEFSIYISQFLNENIDILLDDFQEISNEEIYDFLSIIINNTNEKMHLLIATKASFPQFLARYLLQGNVKIINDRELVFNRNEVLSILSDIRTNQDINQCTDFILDYTEGWPAGVMAIALTLKNERRTLDKGEIIALCKESKVYDYLMYEIFKKLPFTLQTFLIQTSVLNILSADMCNAVMNTSTAKSTLDYLVHENLFVMMLSGKGNVYRYHSIFRDYLRSQINKDVEMDVLKKATLFCLNKNDYEQAVEYAISCNDASLMMSAFEKIGSTMISLGEIMTVTRWVGFLNCAAVDFTPQTKRVLSSFYYYKQDYERAFGLIDSACEDFKSEDNESEYSDCILQKIDFYEKQDELIQGMKEITAAIAFLKKKYSYNWYTLSFRKMELQLLLYNEMNAADTAKEIINGNLQRVRGRDKIKMNAISKYAEIVIKIEKNHMKHEDIEYIADVEDNKDAINSVVISDYYNWCKIQYLYMMQKDDEAYRLTAPYLEQQIRNIFTAYIKIVGYVLLLHFRKNEEAMKILPEIARYLRNSEIESPELLPKDSQRLTETCKVTMNKRSFSEIYVRCFENGLTYVNNQEIKWRTKKTHELFEFLISREGHAASKDIIIEELWPDMPTDKATVLFHTTLCYLRKCMTEHDMTDILQSKSSGYMLNFEQIRTDYNVLMDIKKKVQDGQFQEFEDSENLLELYKTQYFENVSSQWAVSRREQSERDYVICCKKIAGDLFVRKRFDDSINLLKKVINLDPYSEELLIMIMKAFSETGDYKSVKAYYKKIRTIVKEELGREVSSEVVEIYNQILNKNNRNKI